MSYNDAGGGGRPLSEKWSDLLTVKDKKHEIWELKGATELHRLALEDFSQLEGRAEEIDEAIVNATCTIMDGYYMYTKRQDLRLARRSHRSFSPAPPDPGTQRSCC